jgi:hypothetical protein
MPKPNPNANVSAHASVNTHDNNNTNANASANHKKVLRMVLSTIITNTGSCSSTSSNTNK